jgi:hypothetical protein
MRRISCCSRDDGRITGRTLERMTKPSGSSLRCQAHSNHFRRRVSRCCGFPYTRLLQGATHPQRVIHHLTPPAGRMIPSRGDRDSGACGVWEPQIIACCAAAGLNRTTDVRPNRGRLTYMSRGMNRQSGRCWAAYRRGSLQACRNLCLTFKSSPNTLS